MRAAATDVARAGIGALVVSHHTSLYCSGKAAVERAYLPLFVNKVYSTFSASIQFSRLPSANNFLLSALHLNPEVHPYLQKA